MSAVEPLCHLIGIDSSKLSIKENLLLEAELFVRVCTELREIFREENTDYFRLMKLDQEKESVMLDKKFVCLIVQDILSSGEYNIKGIACYADTHEDVVREVLSERNTNPSAVFLRRVIELHRAVKRDLYRKIIKKIIQECSEMT